MRIAKRNSIAPFSIRASKGPGALSLGYQSQPAGLPQKSKNPPVKGRTDLDRAILPFRLRLMRILAKWAQGIVMSRKENEGKRFLFDIPALRVGSNEPFSLIYPEPQTVRSLEFGGGPRRIKVSALVWVGSLRGDLQEKNDGERKVLFSRYLPVRVPFSHLDLHPKREAIPTFVTKATLIRQCGVIREAYGESDIDIYVEGRYDSAAKPLGILFRVVQLGSPRPKKNEKAAPPPPDFAELPKILNGRPLIMQIEKDLRSRGLIPEGTELIVQMRREPNRLDEIEAIGLALKTDDLGELTLSVPAQEIDLVLAIRQHLIKPINDMRPGLFVPRLFAGALETLAFDFIQRGPHHFSFFLRDLRQVPGQEKPQYEKEIPHQGNGRDLSHYSDGETVDANGSIINKTPIPNSALFKLARLMRQDPRLPSHLTPAQQGIVFSDFKVSVDGDRTIKEFLLEFVPRGDRSVTYLQTGAKAAPLSAAEAAQVVAYLQKLVPRSIGITPRMADGILQTIDVHFTA